MELATDIHTMPDSLKRKRDALAEDATHDPERDGAHNKKNKAKDDDISLAETAVADTTDDSTHTVDTNMNIPSTTTNSNTTSVDSLSSDINAVSEDTSIVVSEALSQSHWRKLPGELRNRIYGFLAADEERVVLGRRMVEIHRNKSTQTLYTSFKEAIALHPLSMTCRQLRDEFQEVHVEAAEASWALVVNNFDLEQLQIFSDFIQKGEYIEVVDLYGADAEDWQFNVPVYNLNVSLRFQMDVGALPSALELCHHVYFDKDSQGGDADAPKSLASHDLHKTWLGIPEIIARYVPRTTAVGVGRRSMTFEDGLRIKSVFVGLKSEVEKIPDYKRYNSQAFPIREFGSVSESFDYMEWCWFDEFYHLVDTMQMAEDEQPERARRINEKLERARDSDRDSVYPIESSSVGVD